MKDGFIDLVSEMRWRVKAIMGAQLLNSVLGLIDTFCIVDTGSDDDTVNVIKEYFEERQMKGKVLTKPFQNFEYNRNHALRCCEGMSDYVLLMDADMVLERFTIDKDGLFGSYYEVFQGSKDFFYKNVRLIKNDYCLFKYIGVTHEVLVCEDIDCRPSIIPLSNAFILYS